MAKRQRLADGTTFEREAYVSVVATSARAAIDFFGFGPEARAVDVGPPPDPARWKPGARRWHVYQSAADMPS